MHRCFGVLAGLLLWGSSAFAQYNPPPNPSAAPAPTQTQPPPERLTMAELMRRNGGSLTRATMSTLREAPGGRAGAMSFTAVPDPEPKTIKKHDLITIIIREQTEMSSEGTTDLKKDFDLDARVEEFVRLRPHNFEIEGGAQGPNPPAVKLTGRRNLKGEATVDRSDSLITRISAEVVDVKPNGTFVIQARKSIKYDEEEQLYVLTGVCRAADLTPDNTLLSTQIHDLQMTTTHKGAVRDTGKRGWIPKLLDVVNPF